MKVTRQVCPLSILLFAMAAPATARQVGDDATLRGRVLDRYLPSSTFGTPVSTAGGFFGSGGPFALQFRARVSF